MKRIFLALILCSSVVFAATIKETRSGESILFYTNSGSGVVKVGEIPAAGGLKTNSITNLTGGSVQFPQGISVVGSISLPSESVSNTHVASDAAISGSKVAPATSVTAGVVTTTAQTFSGIKRFDSAIIQTTQAVDQSLGLVTLTSAKSIWYTTLASSVTVDYSGIEDGQQITWVVVNDATDTDYTITGWTPAGRWRFGTAYATVYRSTHNVYTIMRVNGSYYIAATDQMTVAP